MIHVYITIWVCPRPASQPVKQIGGALGKIIFLESMSKAIKVRFWKGTKIMKPDWLSDSDEEQPSPDKFFISVLHPSLENGVDKFTTVPVNASMTLDDVAFGLGFYPVPPGCSVTWVHGNLTLHGSSPVPRLSPKDGHLHLKSTDRRKSAKQLWMELGPSEQAAFNKRVRDPSVLEELWGASMFRSILVRDYKTSRVLLKAPSYTLGPDKEI